MMVAFALVAAAFMGALGRRIAGGWFEQITELDIGDYPVRAFFGLMLACAAFLDSGDWWAFLLIPSTFFGCSIPNFGGIAMGRGAASGGTSWARDAIGLTGHGVLSMAITVLPFVLFPHWYLLLMAGFTIAASYEVGWTVAGGVVGRKSWPFGLQGGSEIGEVVWGAMCGIGAWGMLQ